MQKATSIRRGLDFRAYRNSVLCVRQQPVFDQDLLEAGEHFGDVRRIGLRAAALASAGRERCNLAGHDFHVLPGCPVVRCIEYRIRLCKLQDQFF